MRDRKEKGRSDRSVRCTAAEIPTRRAIDVYVGASLMRLREAAGMDLSEVSAEVAIPADTISRYERGEQRPSASDLLALVELFDVDLREMFPRTRTLLSRQIH